jgi:hypothetical protein
MGISRWNIPLILKRMLEVVMVLGLALIIVLPFIIIPMSQDQASVISGSSNNIVTTLIFLEICGAFCWVILVFLQRMLKTVIETTPFEYKNVKYLKYISYLCATVAVVLIVKTFADFSILTPVVAVIALLASLFCQTLAAVFDKAIRLKDENDLTI